MNSMYARKSYFVRRKKFKAVFIGRKILLSLIAFSMTVLMLGSLFMIVKSCGEDFRTSFNRKMCLDAIPILNAQAKEKPIGEGLDFINFAFGTSFGDVKQNFKVLPVFYTVNSIDVNPLPVQSFFPDNTINEEEVQEDENAKKYETGVVLDKSNPSKDVEIKNQTGYNIDADALSNQPLDFNLSGKNAEILIVHTHGSESYTQSEKYHYSESDNARCQDTRYNVVRVGEELYKELSHRGFNVLHDKTLNDYPSYNNSYNKTMSLIEKYLKKYPSIKCVFDVHRDAIVGENDEKIKFTTQIEGEKVAQVMTVCGTDGLGLENPDWQKNLTFALKIQRYLNEKYPGFMRPVNVRKERFNLHLTKGSVIFEVGTHGNTLDEALASVKYLAEGIEKVLN